MATRTPRLPTTGPPPSRSESTSTTTSSRPSALYDLALEFQERSQRSESRLLEQFEEASENLIAKIGDLIINDDDDERLTLTARGEFRAEVLTEEENEWRPLKTAEELVEYYDPTDVFGDLADALAEAFPGIAPELAAFQADGTGGNGTAATGRGRRQPDADRPR